MLEVLKMLQQMQTTLPPMYVFENVDFRGTEDYGQVVQLLGDPCITDAARFGSYAHRLRLFWTNMVPTHQLQQVLDVVERPAHRYVRDIMEPDRCCMSVTTPHPIHLGYYGCNLGAQREAWPTLMAVPLSRAFREGQPGSVYQMSRGTYDEPWAIERERAMGFQPGDTAAPSTTERQRCHLLGNAMDLNALCSLLAGASALLNQATPTHPSLTIYTISTDQLGAGGGSVGAGVGAITGAARQGPVDSRVLGVIAEQQEGREMMDIWLDEPVVQYLQQQGYAAGATEAEKRRVRDRARKYRWEGKQLYRVMRDGSERLVPSFEARQGLVRVAHEQQGHFGVKRTAALVMMTYHWAGIMEDIRTWVSTCEVCQRSRAEFCVRTPALQSLPIMGMGYRWHVDLFGPIRQQSKQGNRYVMVCVEAYSKWVELIPLPDKEASRTAAAFRREVICRYGAPAEVVTDGGGEFAGQFTELMEQCFVDKRTTSASHPQANGAAERVVQTVKRALGRMMEQHGDWENWEEALDWVALGYRCSTQSSTGFSPYELLTAVRPVPPPARRELHSRQVDMGDDPESVAEQIAARAEAHKEHCQAAMSQMAIAQHRDSLSYARRRSGSYLQQTSTVTVGEYVYVRQPSHDGLQLEKLPVILRVKEVRESGVLVLEGRDGRVVKVNCQNVAPCHLLGVGGELQDNRQQSVTGEECCQVCGSPEHEESMLMCDGCWTGWHMSCLDPPLLQVPQGAWCCPTCVSSGLSAEQLEQTCAEADQQDGKLQWQRQAFPTPAAKQAAEKAMQLDGRLGERRVRSKKSREEKWVYMRVHYRGAKSRPDYFVMVMEGMPAVVCGMRQIAQWSRAGSLRWLPAKTVLPAGRRLQAPPAALMH
jgi:hypothetical protein